MLDVELKTGCLFNPENIELIIEYQAFSLSYDLAPFPSPPSPVSIFSFFLSLPMCRRPSLLRGEWGAGVGGAKSDDDEKARLVLCKSFNTLWFNPIG
jgi:hypothetical protein